MAQKVYVNLIKGPANEERTIAVTARPSGRGILAFWKVEPGGGNTDLKYVSAGHRARVERICTWIRDGKFRNTLKLPHVGGDKYKVKVSKDSAGSGSIATKEIETWRKIYFSVHYMNRKCRRLFDLAKPAFIGALEKGKVDVEEVERKACKLDERYTPATDSRLLHLYDRNVLAHKPFHLRIVVVNDLFDWKDETYTKVLAGTRSWTRATRNPLSHQANWLRAATAQLQPGGGQPAGPLCSARAWVTKSGAQQLKVKLPYFSDLARGIRAGRTVKIEVKTKERDHYNGHSIGNFVCVRINRGQSTKRTKESVMQTFVHEVGHGLKQAVQDEKLYNAGDGADTGNLEDHPTWHTDVNGGQGPHCWKNEQLDAHNIYYCPSCAAGLAAGPVLCVMSYAADVHRAKDGSYCEQCLPRLKRADLSRSQMANWNSD